MIHLFSNYLIAIKGKKIIVCLFFFTVFAATNSTLLLWQQNYELTRKDFRGKIDKTSRFQANTSTSINIRIILDDTIKATVNAYFDKHKSWMKAETPEKVIAHERLHFDLTEIYAREIRKRIKEIKKSSYDNKTKKIQITYAYQILTKKMIAEQALYDKETEHSINSKKQSIWKDSITKRLVRLQIYQ